MQTLGMHSRDIPELPCRNLQKCLNAHARWRLKAGLRLDSACDPLGKDFAGGQRHIEASCEEALQYLKIGSRQFCDTVIRQRKAGVRLRHGSRRCEKVRGKGACGLGADRRLFDSIADHQRARRKITQSLVIACRKDGNGADRLKEWDLVNIANEISRHRFE